MKRLFSLVLFLLVLFAFAFGGLFFYAQSKAPAIALKANLSELDSLKDIKILKSDITSKSILTINSAIYPGGSKTQDLSQSYVQTIDVPNDKVTREGTTTQTLTLKQYNDENQLSSKDVWFKLIDAGKYTKNEDDKDWIFSFDSKEMADTLVSKFQTAFQASFTSSSSAGFTATVANPKYGNINAIIKINKKTYVLDSIEVSVPGGIKLDLTLNITDPTLLAQLKAVGIKDFTGTISVDEISFSSVTQSSELKDGVVMPENSIVLLLADLTGKFK